MEKYGQRKRWKMKYPLYRKELCPKLWHMDEDGYRLDNQVRNMLLKIATDFVSSLKNDNEIDIKIHDVVIIGSIANYNWTDYSDVDLHIITDYGDLEMSPEDAQTMFDAIKVNWNNRHDIVMKGHDVELYIQDKTHKPVSTAEYSVLNHKWIKEPKKESPKFNKELIKKKYREYKQKIESSSQEGNETKLKKLLEKLYNFRQAGLDEGGELSEENIVFKILRARGYLDKLKDNIAKFYDKKMSVTEGGSDDFSNKIAQSVYTFLVNKRYHPVEREGNTITSWETPTPKQMKYLQGKSGSFIWSLGNMPVYWIHDPHEPNKIKFTWNPF